MRVLTAALAMLLLSAEHRALFAQTNNPFAIRVDSNLVQVHVEVANKKAMRNFSRNARLCGAAALQRFRSLTSAEPYLPPDCSDWMIHNLTADAFRVFEDGSEQKIQSVTLEPNSEITARDNVASHNEWSHTPKGKWSNWYPIAIPSQTFHYYSVAYVPPRATAGKCHSISVTVSRPDAIVFAPAQYCYVPHPATDPLFGTDLGRQLEGELDSDGKPEIPLMVEAGILYADAHRPRVNIVLQFPWDRLKHSCTSSGDMKSNVAVLGVVYTADHSRVIRFSDTDSAGTVVGPHITDRTLAGCNRSARAWLPTHYETQIDLPPGKYDLRVVLSDGEKFGRANVSILVDEYDGKQLALSSAILFKRFGNAFAAAKEAAYVNLAPEYVPLVSRDQQITPTADPTFSQNELVPVYFEVYEPFLADQPAITVKAHARIVSVNTGARRSFNWFDATEFRRAGTTTFAIAKEFDMRGLNKGEYRLEVQASDSAGHTTPWRSASLILY